MLGIISKLFILGLGILGKLELCAKQRKPRKEASTTFTDASFQDAATQTYQRLVDNREALKGDAALLFRWFGGNNQSEPI